MKFKNILIATAVVAGSFASAANAQDVWSSTSTAALFNSQHGFWINQDASDGVVAPLDLGPASGTFTQIVNFNPTAATDLLFHWQSNSNLSGVTAYLDFGTGNQRSFGTPTPNGSGAYGQALDSVLTNVGSGWHTLTIAGSYIYTGPNLDGNPNTWYGAVTAVPEPESYAMLLAGLGLIGMVTRRRNKADVA